MKEKMPAKIKRTQVRGYNNQKWNSVSHKVMETALNLKFTQSKECKDFLVDTNKLVLVEANKYDSYWSIGKSLEAACKENKEQWGLNRLGSLLMATREKLKQ